MTAANGKGLYSIAAAQVERMKVRFLLPFRVPLAAICLLIGDPGLGKTLWACKLVASTTNGELGEPGVALILSAEDAPGPVLRPRVEAAGANLDLVRFVGVRRDGFEEGVLLPDDAAELSALVAETKARLLVIDPLSAHLSERVNSWRDQSVRTALAPLARIATEHGCAVVVIAHLNKAMGADPLYRSGGSIGIPAAARSALLLTRDPDDPDGERGSRRVLTHFKSNYGELAPSLGFNVESVEIPTGSESITTARLVDTGESSHAAHSLLAKVPEEQRTARDDAVDLLRAELADGPRPATEVEAAAEEAGITKTTLKRAKAQLGISVKNGTVQKDGTTGGWLWALTLFEEGQPSVAPFEEGHSYTHKVTPFDGNAENGTANTANGTLEAAQQPEEGHLGDMALFAADDPPLCRYPAHRPSDWLGDGGRRICGVCHPKPKVAK